MNFNVATCVLTLTLLTPWVGRGWMVDGAQCVGISTCVCIFDDGSGIVDLSSLANTDGTARFKDSASDMYTYAYNPCNPITELTCTNAAVCQISADGTAAYNAGDASSASFSATSKDIQINYNSYTGGTYRNTEVTFVCDQGADTPIYDPFGEMGSASYYIQITTKCACKNGCSGADIHIDIETSITTGSILLIVFFVLMFVYFTAGILFNKIQRQQTGAEMVPNVAFWRALPGLIKDGFVFTFGKVRGKKRGYDEV